jgi:outer membrane protein TolC
MKRWAAILIGSLLTGCARFHPQPLAPVQNAERLESRSLTNEALRAFVATNSHRELPIWPLESWDFDLLTWAAFFYHPSLEVVRAQWAVAQGGEITAAQRPNPSLTVTPGYNTTTSMPSPWLPLTFLDIPIETAGKRRFRKAIAAQLSEAARLNIANVAWQVRSDLRAGLIELLSSEQHQILFEQQVNLQSNIVDLLQGQVAVGAIARSETVPFRIAFIKARLDLVDSQRLAAEARARVAEAIGVPLQAVEGFKFSFDAQAFGDALKHFNSVDVRRTALLSRPDILAALAEYAASEAALRLEIAKQYPDVHIQPGYQFDQGDNKWTLGLVVDLPILNQNQGPIAEAKARRLESAAKFNALQAKVLAEIDRASQGVRVAEKNLLALRALGEEQTKRLESVSEQLRAGAVDRLELFNAQFEGLTAEVAQLDGQLKVQQAVGALEDAVRRPFELPAVVFEPTQIENHGP